MKTDGSVARGKGRETSACRSADTGFNHCNAAAMQCRTTQKEATSWFKNVLVDFIFVFVQ